MKKRTFLAFVALVVAVTAVVAVRAAEKEEGLFADGKELFKQIQLFADSVTIISADYVEPVKPKDLVYGAIRGMMDTLDGYSQFLDPESFKEITEETQGEFGGLGIKIGIKEGVLTVIAPMEDTPAYEAGLQAGDKVVKIDDEVTRDMSLDDAVKKLRGDPGTKVKLTVVREDEVLEFTVTRAIIKLKSIKEASVIEKDIGYVKLVEFQQRTPVDLKKNIEKLIQEGAKGLIIDVRNNPGGLLDASVESADIFLEPGTMIVYTEGRDPEKRTEFKAKEEAYFRGIPLIVLVNKGSASASEIFAGAMKDNKRGIVLGVPTFGKGSVQTVIPLQDRSALRLTTAAYYTPLGKNLREKGIEPNIYVEKVRTEDKKEEGSGKEEKKKAKIFDKLIDKARKKEEGKIARKEPREYDNQVRAAINILKGLQIFEGYEEKTGQKEAEKE